MADPVTLAMVGAAAGAALKPKDPLKGAMLGATVGFTGGTALGAGAAGAAGTGAAGGLAGGTGLAASGAGGTGLAAAGTTATGTGLGLTAPAATSGLGLTSGASGLGVAAPTSFAGVGLTPSTMAAPTFAQQLSGAGTFLKENPMYALQGMNSAQGLLQQEQMPQAPQGQVQRGQPMAPVNFASLLNPQQYKPQPISLLG
jgi:hypothetical protein